MTTVQPSAVPPNSASDVAQFLNSYIRSMRSAAQSTTAELNLMSGFAVSMTFAASAFVAQNFQPTATNPALAAWIGFVILLIDFFIVLQLAERTLKSQINLSRFTILERMAIVVFDTAQNEPANFPQRLKDFMGVAREIHVGWYAPMSPKEFTGKLLWEFGFGFSLLLPWLVGIYLGVRFDGYFVVPAFTTGGLAVVSFVWKLASFRASLYQKVLDEDHLDMIRTKYHIRIMKAHKL